MASKKLKKVHVTLDDSKRIINFEEDEGVSGLRHLFLRVFSDVLSDDVAPANVRFQQYDETFNEYVDLENGQKLVKDARLKAIIASTKEKKESHSHICCTDDASAECHPHCHPHGHPHCHIVIPWYRVEECEMVLPDHKPHTIKQDVNYRIWNIVSDGLIHQDGSNVTGKGGFGGNPQNVVVQAKSVGNNEFNLVFNGDGPSNNYQYITSKGEGKQVIIQSSPTSESVFVPDYYWGHTMFRSKPYRTLYLGADDNKILTLVPMEDPLYPNPQALFVVNKYNPPT